MELRKKEEKAAIHRQSELFKAQAREAIAKEQRDMQARKDAQVLVEPCERDACTVLWSHVGLRVARDGTRVVRRAGRG